MEGMREAGEFCVLFPVYLLAEVLGAGIPFSFCLNLEKN